MGRQGRGRRCRYAGSGDPGLSEGEGGGVRDVCAEGGERWGVGGSMGEEWAGWDGEVVGEAFGVGGQHASGEEVWGGGVGLWVASTFCEWLSLRSFPCEQGLTTLDGQNGEPDVLTL